jgi:hypothetical protein
MAVLQLVLILVLPALIVQTCRQVIVKLLTILASLTAKKVVENAVRLNA